MPDERRSLTASFERFCGCLNDFDVECVFIALDDLIQNKRAAGRPKDLADVAALESAGKG